MTYKLIVMSFDGEYQTERPEFENVDDVWSYANDLGSKWYFYPFYFVIDQTEEIVATGPMLEHLEGWSLEDVKAHFAEKSRRHGPAIARIAKPIRRIVITRNVGVADVRLIPITWR